ncbi:MAG TPA: sulfite exporter TauE/SafE family protein [Polyangiaceae bacterium]|jgi:hypothetical protein
MTLLTLILLFLAAALGGALNAVAGGGSFIAFPALLFSGVAPVAANATNTVALWPAGVASALAYRNDLPGPRSMLLALSAASLVGGIAGAELLLKTKDTTFILLLPWLLFVATVLFTLGGKLTARFRKPGAHTRALPVVLGVQVVIAIYGGYFGGGMGILMLAVLSLVGMTNIHSMNAIKTILSAVINGVAVVLFVVADAVAWKPGIVMVAGGILGGYAGAAMARKLDPAKVKRFVGIVAWGMTAYFFYKTYLAGGISPAKP